MDAAQKQMLAEPARSLTEAVSLAGAPVLVIDDDANVLDLMNRLLTKEGFHVITAANGDDGLRLARERRPMAITLDVLMPGVDGWTVLSTLKADPDLSEIPVILVTISDNESLGYALGASEYLSKPINRDRLVSVLRKYQDTYPPGSALVVEDDQDTRSLLRETLESHGWQVTETGDGNGALEEVARNRPALILLDLLMPGMDGFDFLEHLHKLLKRCATASRHHGQQWLNSFCCLTGCPASQQTNRTKRFNLIPIV